MDDYACHTWQQAWSFLEVSRLITLPDCLLLPHSRMVEQTNKYLLLLREHADQHANSECVSCVHNHLEMQLKKTLWIILACLLLYIGRVYVAWKKWVYSWKRGNSENKGKLSGLLYLKGMVSNSLNALLLVRRNCAIVFTRSGFILSKAPTMEAIDYHSDSFLKCWRMVHFVCHLMQSG